MVENCFKMAPRGSPEGDREQKSYPNPLFLPRGSKKSKKGSQMDPKWTPKIIENQRKIVSGGTVQRDFKKNIKIMISTPPDTSKHVILLRQNH
jgi:hypothetical protein